MFMLLHFSAGFCQTYSDIVPDKEIIDFIEQNEKVLGKRILSPEIYSWSVCELIENKNDCWIDAYLMKQNDTILTKQDLEYFNKQNDSFIIKKQDKFEHIDDKFPKHFNYISIPLSSEDKSLAVIKIGHFCGDECGSGGILIFRFIKGKWEKIDFRNTWLS